MKNKLFLLGLMALTSFVSAAQNYEVSLGNYFSNLAGMSYCNSVFFVGQACGFYIMGFAFIALWIYYCVSVQMPSDGIILSTSLLCFVLGDQSVGLLPYGINISIVLFSGVILAKAFERAVASD